MEELYQRIETLLNDALLFRNPELTLMDLTKELASNRLYVSRAINKGCGMSFTQYICRKRIDYAIALMHEKPAMSLDGIATESGFASGRTFARKFKEVMGETPADYRATHP